MKKLLLIFVLTILTAQKALSVNFTETIKGCKSEIFESTYTFQLIKIDFSTACKNLEDCAEEYKTDRVSCLKNFKKDMMEICKEINPLNFLRSKICKKQALINSSISLDLEENLFNFAEKKFKANIVNNIKEISNGCLEINEQFTLPCLYGNPNQIFNFFYLEKIDRWVIQNFEEDLCMDKELSFVECDFENEDLRMEIFFEPSGNGPPDSPSYDSSAFIRNVDGVNLKLKKNGIGNSFAPDTSDQVFLIFAKEIEEEEVA